jgi:hypothetical protein
VPTELFLHILPIEGLISLLVVSHIGVAVCRRKDVFHDEAPRLLSLGVDEPS